MALVESLNGASLNASVIIDKTGCPWSLVASAASGLQVMIKGTIDTTTANVTLLLYWNHGIYYESGTQWYKRSSGKWVTTTDPRITESPSGSTLNSTSGTITDANNNVWTLANGTGLEVMMNGAAAGYSANVTLLLYWKHVVYQMNNSGGWWSWTNNAWANASDPRVTPTPAPTPSPTPPASGTIQINLGTIIGPASPYVGGAATEGMDAPGVNDYAPALNSGFQNTWNSENWMLFRINCAGNDYSLFEGASTASNNWFNGSPSFWNGKNRRMVFTTGPGPGGASPNDCVAVANYFKAQGQECMYWEAGGNEPDGAGASAWQSYFTANRNALKAVNPNYQVGGPTTSYARGDFFQAAAAAGADFISWHCYLTGGYSDNASLFNLTVQRQRSDVALARQYFAPTVPIFLGEYNIDYNGQEPMMQTIDGGVYTSLYLQTAMVADPYVQMGAIWTIGTNANFTIVNNDGSNVRPSGSVLGVLSRKIGGNQVQVNTGSGLGQLMTYACCNGSNWTVWFTNYNTSSAYTVNVAGLTGTDYNYWECSPANPTPMTSTETSSTLANLTIPSRSVVVISNF